MDERSSSTGTTGRSSTGTTGQGAADKLPQQAAQVKDQVQQAAVGLKEQVTEQATTRLEDQKTVASDGINTVANAFRQASDQLREQDQAGIARYLDQASAQVENFANYLGRRDVREIARDAEGFARREPALFLGGALALGLFAARFLKSSGQTTQATGSQAVSNDWRGKSEWYGQPPALPAGRPQAVAPSPMPSTYPGTSAGLSGRGGVTSDDVIVGGPPITDALVGGPPIERKREW